MLDERGVGRVRLRHAVLADRLVLGQRAARGRLPPALRVGERQRARAPHQAVVSPERPARELGRVDAESVRADHPALGVLHGHRALHFGQLLGRQQRAVEKRGVEGVDVRHGGHHGPGGPEPRRVVGAVVARRVDQSVQRLVHAGVRPADRGRPRQRGVAQTGGGDHPLREVLLGVLAGELLDQQPGDDVVGVRVRVPLAGGAGGRRREPEPHQFLRLDPVEAVLVEAGPRALAQRGERAADVVPDAAGVVEQHAHGDRAGELFRQQPRQVVADRVVQVHPPLGDLLENGDGDERLGDAADPVPHLRCGGPFRRDVGDSGRAPPAFPGAGVGGRVEPVNARFVHRVQ